MRDVAIRQITFITVILLAKKMNISVTILSKHHASKYYL